MTGESVRLRARWKPSAGSSVATLASGEWAIAWVAARRGKQTVRVSPVSEGGQLIGPTDVADAADARALDSALDREGLDVAWSDAATQSLKVARVVRVNR